eukprot:2038792-Lingulodinium_polyedra.AAC.1
MKTQSFVRKGRRHVLQFIDVKKAHFWGRAERELYVELPRAYTDLRDIIGDMVGKLRRSMYGCRDAAAIWEKEVARVVLQLGYRKGES